MSSASTRSLRFAWVLTLSGTGIWFLSGCQSTPLYPPKLSASERRDLVKAVQEIRAEQTGSKQSLPTPGQRTVRIFTQPIQLPETAAGWEDQKYSIYVWASHPALPGVGVRQLLESGLLQLDIVGAKLQPEEPENPAKAGAELEKQGFSAAAHALANDQVLELVVRAGEIESPIRIAAWFPAEYRMEQRSDASAKNATNWSDAVFVPIRSGDLTTKIEIIDQLEARASFGDEFPRHFYVGRVYLRNNNSSKKLIVYTTSMRAPVYLFRRTEPEIAETDDKAGTPPNSPRNSGAPGHPKIAPNDPPCPKQEPPASPADAGPPIPPPLELVTRLVEDLQSLATDTPPPRPISEETNARMAQIRGQLEVWVRQERHRLKSRIRTLAARIDGYSTLPSPANTKLAEDTTSQLQSAWRALFVGPDKPEAAHAAFIALAKRELGPVAPSFTTEADALLKLHLEKADLEHQLAYLQGRTSPDYAMAARLLGRAIQAGLLPVAGSASPFDDQQGISVGLVDNTSPIVADQHKATERALFSEKSCQQWRLDETGYIWRDSSRPLTFQAVLHSLILTQETARRTQVFKAFDLIGRVAGGLTGLGAVEEEFGREGYARVVAFYASVFTPELGALLLEDLKKHIRNLGEMSMDTVMVIPPRGVEDRYVFFPRGPFFNHPDEFDQHSPAYIVKILGDEVGVQAELVDMNTTVNGADAAAGLVSAFNTGSPSATATLARQSEIRAQLANTELSIALGKVEKALIRRQKTTDPEARSTAENDARRVVREFRLQHKVFGDTAFADLFAQYGLQSDDAPPELSSTAPLRLIAGTVSTPRPLLVKDDRTPLADLSIRGSVSGENVIWRADDTITAGNRSYQVDATALPGTTPEELRNTRITVKDHLGNETTADQSITLVPAAPDFEPKPVIRGENQSELKIPKKPPTDLTITLPLHDSASDGWTVELGEELGLDVRPDTVPLHQSAAGEVSATVSIDASSLKGSDGKTVDAAKLTVRILRNGKLITTSELTIKPQ